MFNKKYIQNICGRTLHSHQRKVHQSNISVLNTYAPNARAPKFVKETFLNLILYIIPHSLVVGGFSAQLSPIDRSSRKILAKNNEINWHYESNATNRYLQSISPKHKRIISSSQYITEHISKTDHSESQSKPQQM